MAMLQQQRPGAQSQRSRDPVPSAPPREMILSSTVGSTTAASSVTSQSMTNRRVTLGQSYYEAAKKGVAEALSQDERGDRMAALELYNKVLSTLSLGLGQVKRGGDPAMVEIRRKMEKMKEQVKSRMEVLLDEETESRQMSASTTSRAAEPVSRTGEASLSASTTSRAGLSSTTRGTSGGTRVSAKADLVFTADTGIGLFQVDSQDHVRKFEDVDNLCVFRYHERIKGQPPAFLQCNGFIYPLIPGRSPVLKASERVYMFPDLKGEDGCTVGLTLEGASEEEVSQLDRLLTVMADMRKPGAEIKGERVREKEEAKQRVRERGKEGEEVVGKPAEREKEEEKPTWGTTIAEGIGKGVGLVSKGISEGTAAAGNLISKGATKLREKIEPNEQPTEIPEPVQKGVHVAKKTTGYVVSVSDFLMVSLAKLTVKVGKEVKNTVANSEYMKDREINPHAKEAWKVTKSGVIGAATVFGDLERGAVALIGSLGTETSKTVEHKYGEQAGRVTEESLDTGKNVVSLAYTYYSWKTWGIRFLGKIGEVIRQEDSKQDASKQPH